MGAPARVKAITERLPWKGDTMAECLENLELPPGYRMWASKHTARFRHSSFRTGAELEEFAAWLERVLPHRARVEYYDGWVVVTGMASHLHAYAIRRFDSLIFPVAEAGGWQRGHDTEIWDDRVREKCMPDHTLVGWDAPYLDGQDRYLGRDVVMATEVTSADSVEDDRVRKRDFYARTGVPVYLLVDLHADEVVLFTDPAHGAYGTRTAVPIGKRIDLPAPIGLALETGRMAGRMVRPDHVS